MIPPTLRILVCTEAIDMRLGFDRLAAAVREKLGADPVAGGLYIFANRGRCNVPFTCGRQRQRDSPNAYRISETRIKPPFVTYAI